MARYIDSVDKIAGVVHNLTATAAAATMSTATSDNIYVIRVATDTDIRVAIGKAALVATATDTLIPAGTVERFKIPLASYVSVIKKVGAADGVVTITEMTQ